MSKTQDLTGQIFSRLVVIKFNHKKNRASYWLCKCKCGKEISVRSDRLKDGNTKSCGCIYTERITKMGLSKRTHGMKNTKEYRAWSSMKGRCFNKKNDDYNNYGGRGITVCKRWIDRFENFFEDMGYAHSKKYSLDRYPNMNGNYEKSNCRWATAKQQVLNSRKIKFHIIDGKQMYQLEASKYINISHETFRKYKNLGYTAQQIKDRFHYKNN